jgi:hypothetical protein
MRLMAAAALDALLDLILANVSKQFDGDEEDVATLKSSLILSVAWSFR